MKKSLVILLAVAGLCGIATTGCTQFPTEKQGVTDMRPQLSFKYDDSGLDSAQVQVDGLDMGTVGDYRDGKAALRILPGTHLVRINVSGRPVLEEKIYLGDGVNRTILVK